MTTDPVSACYFFTSRSTNVHLSLIVILRMTVSWIFTCSCLAAIISPLSWRQPSDVTKCYNHGRGGHGLPLPGPQTLPVGTEVRPRRGSHAIDRSVKHVTSMFGLRAYDLPSQVRASTTKARAASRPDSQKRGVSVPARQPEDRASGCVPRRVARVLHKADDQNGRRRARPFVGSGSAAIAPRRLGRRYLGVELSEEYLWLSGKRLARTPSSGK